MLDISGDSRLREMGCLVRVINDIMHVKPFISVSQKNYASSTSFKQLFISSLICVSLLIICSSSSSHNAIRELTFSIIPFCSSKGGNGIIKLGTSLRLSLFVCEPPAFTFIYCFHKKGESNASRRYSGRTSFVKNFINPTLTNMLKGSMIFTITGTPKVPILQNKMSLTSGLQRLINS